ncbi:signal recognition particle-docking protein FtsY [Citricoccus sp.]|uniref:signal recognition particle-docking protein FtsY n=2 Tax=Micrococcales TaxID=85006 RepID=UPI00160A1614|nr:signal recognition particle-docking protein FtsY [Citricoccus sp.]MBB5748466.1 fused signal recognition particle receptor [Micrococcus sp. TA1]HRO93647.1 signal recognition particle-docking protein FtsY [Citricoccus sp.]
MDPIILISVAVILIVGISLLLFLDRRPRLPAGTYPTTRDPNDPAGGGSTAVLDRPEADQTVVGDVAAADSGLIDEDRVDAGTAVAEPEAPAAPELERPAPAAGRLARLRARLAKSNNIFGKGLLALLSTDNITDDVWDEVEETLLLADLGTEPTMELVDRLRERVTVEGSRDPQHVKGMLREELVRMVDPTMDRRLDASRKDGRPAVMMVVGVNGVGKTTTVGKIARVLVAEDRQVVLGAADTFRAAAAEQLATWGARVGVDTVRSEEDGADPASVAFDAVRTGIDQEADVVIVDTAGRLQNKANLMDELGKIKRVIEKQATVDEVLLVLDATTGQNGLSQAKVFAEVVDVTGIVLTKLDGTAKGGIVVAIQRQLGVPVKLIGLGEGPDDLAPFQAEGFVDALLED